MSDEEAREQAAAPPEALGSESPPEDGEAAEQMCCDGERTAAEHRKESPDGKCCSDS